MYEGTTYDNLNRLFLFVLCLLVIFGYIIYTFYRDYKKYQSQEGMKKFNRMMTKTANSVKKHTKKIAKGAASIKGILEILKCPVSIFSNISKCGGFYYRDKLFEIIWGVVWIINFILIFFPLFVADKIICAIFKRCVNITPNDVCISRKTFFKFIENIYFLLSGGGRYLYRTPGEVKKCYCTPPLIMYFDPLRSFRSYFERLIQTSPNYVALLFPILIMIILAFRQKK